MEKSPLENSANEIERMYLRPLNDKKLAVGAHEEENRPRADGCFQRDYARIMYSSSFRRLQGKDVFIRFFQMLEDLREMHKQ